MSEKRRGLGRGLGALIPSSASAQGNGSSPSRPVDLFFPEARKTAATTVETLLEDSSAADSVPAADASSAASAVNGAGAAKASTKAAATRPSTAKTAAPSKPAAKAAGSRSAANKKAADAAESTAPAAPAAPATPSAPEVELVEVPGARFAEIPVGDIHPNRKQPRSVFDEDDMAELVHSVREIGVLQPIVVRTSTEKGGEPYELVMGERRWRAVQAAGLETIPAIVRDTTDDDLLRDALLENLHRSQLNPLEEAAAYQQLLEDFGTTHEQLADRIGRSRPQVSNTLRLLKLPPLVQRRVAAGVLSAGHARALLALPDAAAMERMAQKIVAEGMSVRATEESVALYQDPTTPAKSSIPKPNARHERLDYLASSLSDRLDTNVKITLGARKGRVSIEFASVEDLNRIMDVLGPGAED
ncbi:Chromosome (plasmid) partitioning protein ParB / Stage 0 sporulation protein J [Arthrobacter sp. 9V]|uniref:ParB/RepB/Spo0J family partition protein n=1 Tax=Arthrobacter sp. 9V TaxID=2653132 RepID=UPI0012F1DEC0|nr:ParB/RepB/Spo0J family partition protein [Arthrobacter sp. 9V]VXC50747.1 Chromosome (plasmid) partitioning protein ParB / Stage 0 sporulation protein J [Arthrobacter sp. 9V]